MFKAAYYFCAAFLLMVLWLIVCQLIFLHYPSLTSYSIAWRLVAVVLPAILAFAVVWRMNRESRNIRLVGAAWMAAVVSAVLASPALLCFLANDCF